MKRREGKFRFVALLNHKGVYYFEQGNNVLVFITPIYANWLPDAFYFSEEIVIGPGKNSTLRLFVRELNMQTSRKHTTGFRKKRKVDSDVRTVLKTGNVFYVQCKSHFYSLCKKFKLKKLKVGGYDSNQTSMNVACMVSSRFVAVVEKTATAEAIIIYRISKTKLSPMKRLLLNFNTS